jgi:hypothetical protein
VQYLAQLDEEAKDREAEGEMERNIFATNPALWKHMYAPNMNEDGEVILTPGSPEELKEMAAEWGLTPEEIAELG